MSFLNPPPEVRLIFFDFASLDSVKCSNPTENHFKIDCRLPSGPRQSQGYHTYLIPVYVLNPQGRTRRRLNRDFLVTD